MFRGVLMGDYKKILKSIKHKKGKAEKFLKNNKPKDRKFGLGQKQCDICGKKGFGHISKYGLNYCRRCFREKAPELGFKKYN